MHAEALRVWVGDVPEVDMTNRSARLAVNVIVRGHLDRRLDDQTRADRYGRMLTDYVLTDLDEAEVALLPWGFEHADPTAFRRLVAEAEGHGLRTLVFGATDLEPIMPSASIILLHPGPTRGAQPRADVLSTPYFFTDRAHGVVGRPDAARPSIAFCGQGASRPGASVVQAVERLGQIVRNRIRPEVVAPPVRGHVGLRAEALRRLAAHPGVDDHFVIRDRYRAGAVDDDARARTQAKFDANLTSATYALCVRGTGNFSARFYEALSFGRIPVLVDTGGVLPADGQIDWRSRCVWVERDEVGDIGARLVAHHEAGDPDGLRTPDALRSLWEQHLTEDGFFHHLVADVRRLL